MALHILYLLFVSNPVKAGQNEERKIKSEMHHGKEQDRHAVNWIRCVILIIIPAYLILAIYTEGVYNNNIIYIDH